MFHSVSFFALISNFHIHVYWFIAPFLRQWQTGNNRVLLKMMSRVRKLFCMSHDHISKWFPFTEQARMDHVDTMLRECCIMQGMQNAVNVNGILAACLTNPSQPLLVYPYADQGNLKKFLQKCKMSELAASHVSTCIILIWLKDCKPAFIFFTKGVW